MAPVTETIEIDMGPAAREVEAFAALLEKHAAQLAKQAASFRADLAELMAAKAEDPGAEGTEM